MTKMLDKLSDWLGDQSIIHWKHRRGTVALHAQMWLDWSLGRGFYRPFDESDYVASEWEANDFLNHYR